MKTLLVAGGAGFIGSNFIYHELERRTDVRIVCIDKLTYAGNLATLRHAMDNSNFRFVRVDITNARAVEHVFAEEHPDTVVNFVAESHVDRSILDPGLFLNTNVIGTQVLMDACRRFGVERFHQVSTDEVYGDLPLDRPDLLFTEDSPLRSSNPYSASKAGADLLAMSYMRTYGLPVSISRSSNNYGAYQFPEKLIPLMILNALDNKPLPVYGTGANIRDWIYVSDHCSAIDRILTDGVPGRIYNVGGGTELTNLEVVRRICTLLGKPESLITFMPDRKGHDLRYALDCSRMETELGWRPTVGFDEGLNRTVQWYLDNDAWCRGILTGEYAAYCRSMYGGIFDWEESA